MASVVGAAFLAAHAGVEDVLAGGRAVVGSEDQDRILFEPVLVQVAHEPADVVVDVGDHPEEAGLA